jgi:CheY-like chemotaxis protein
MELTMEQDSCGLENYGRSPESARILVIDDEPVMRATLQYVLEDLGYRVCVAATGQQGFELFERLRPDLVITDIFMPEVDGFATMKHIRRVAPSVPIIAMSAIMDEQQMERRLPGGACCCVQKPVDERLLAELLCAMLEPEPRADG